MIRVNLLSTGPGVVPQREWLPREQRSAVMGLLMLLVTATGVGGWWWYLHSSRAAAEQGIAQADAQLNELKDALKVLDRANARKAELNERLGLIDRLKTAKREPLSLLETVSQSLPDGMWLLEIKQIGSAVQIEGRAMSLTMVTDFTQRVQNSGLFKPPVEILTTITETVEEMTVVRFAIKGQAAAAPAPVSTKGASTSQSGM